MQQSPTVNDPLFRGLGSPVSSPFRSVLIPIRAHNMRTPNTDEHNFQDGESCFIQYLSKMGKKVLLNVNNVNEM